jgi:hypothetical protein
LKGFPQLFENIPLSVNPAMYIRCLTAYSAQGDERTVAVMVTFSTSIEEQNLEAKEQASSVGLTRDAISGCISHLIESGGPK